MPHITKENLLAERPGVSSINTEKTYQNEVLGEFYHGEATIITPDRDKGDLWRSREKV